MLTRRAFLVWQVLIFDYRCRHRGLANKSTKQRPVAYVTYSVDGASDRNFPDAATLATVSAERSGMEARA